MVENFFALAYCICLDKRKDECVIHTQLAQRGLVVNKFVCGSGQDTSLKYDYIDEFPKGVSRPQAWNYARCFFEVIKKAKAANVGSLLYLEDDATLTERFDEISPAAAAQLAGLPPYDVLFYGCNNTCGKVKRLSENIVQSTYSLDLHAVIFKRSIFDKLLSLGDCPNHTLDGKVGELQRSGEYTFYSIYPSIIVQRPCYSWNEHRFDSKLDRQLAILF